MPLVVTAREGWRFDPDPGGDEHLLVYQIMDDFPELEEAIIGFADRLNITPRYQ